MQTFWSGPTHDAHIDIRDLVEVFFELENEKRKKWLSPRTVPSFDSSVWIATVPSENDKNNKSSIEDAWNAVVEDSCALLTRHVNDILNDALHNIVSSLAGYNQEPDIIPDETARTVFLFKPCYIGEDGNQIYPNHGCCLKGFRLYKNCYYAGALEQIINNKTNFVYDEWDKERLAFKNEH